MGKSMSYKTIQYILLTNKNDITTYLSGIRDLYHRQHWYEKLKQDHEIESLIAGSFCFIAVCKENRVIGSGRVISDGYRDAYLHSIVVDPDYRGQGIGQNIVRQLVDFCYSHQIDWIGLIAEPGAQIFYEKIGFHVLPNKVPMLIRKKE